MLEAFVQEQIQDTIFDLDALGRRRLRVRGDARGPDEDIGLSVSIENVIMEGSRRLEEWNRIKKKIPSTDIVFKMATAPGEGTFEISLKPIEWNLLLLVDGSRSVAELAQRPIARTSRSRASSTDCSRRGFSSSRPMRRSRPRGPSASAREAESAQVEAQSLSAVVAAQAAGVPETRLRPSRLCLESPSHPPVPPTPEEVPRFLGAELAGPTEADAAVLDEVIGALFSAPSERNGPSPVPPAPPRHTPAEEPAFISASQGAEEAVAEPEVSLEDLLAGIKLPARRTRGRSRSCRCAS